MTNDWVEFKIATDRRNKLQRATCVTLLEESFIVPKEEREMVCCALLTKSLAMYVSILK